MSLSTVKLETGLACIVLNELVAYFQSRITLLEKECADPNLQHKNLRLTQGARLELLALLNELDKLNV